LEAAVPFHTPSTIIEDAGDQWTQYSLSHSGLGIWNKDRHLKLSLELICGDYVGALLPTVVDHMIEWNNSASIVLTTPMNETFWAESRLLAVSNGAAYEALVQYLKDHEKRYLRYQVSLSLCLSISHLSLSLSLTLLSSTSACDYRPRRYWRSAGGCLRFLCLSRRFVR
jgi:hypothetical protein